MWPLFVKLNTSDWIVSCTTCLCFSTIFKNGNFLSTYYSEIVHTWLDGLQRWLWIFQKTLRNLSVCITSLCESDNIWKNGLGWTAARETDCLGLEPTARVLSLLELAGVTWTCCLRTVIHRDKGSCHCLWTGLSWVQDHCLALGHVGYLGLRATAWESDCLGRGKSCLLCSEK